MEDNVYAPPQSDLEPINTNEEAVLASRISRLGASILDSLIMMAITLPVMFFTGAFEGITSGATTSTGYNIGISILGIIIFFAINAKFLINDGQTIGKKAAGIKIVDLEGNLPTMKQHITLYTFMRSQSTLSCYVLILMNYNKSTN